MAHILTADKDVGCDESPSCLSCPLPGCKFDKAHQEETRIKRDITIWTCVNLYSFTIKEMAEHLKVSEKTVRIVAKRPAGDMSLRVVTKIWENIRAL